ncbi:MAG: hypothetical protein U0R28_10855 [Candidatus Nanopelagicales bacterium]
MLKPKFATLGVTPLLLLAGCSGSQLTLDSTCREYLSVDQDSRYEQVNQLGMDVGWEGSGNPLYLINLDAICGQAPDSPLSEFVHG